jgi:hypothetical protein
MSIDFGVASVRPRRRPPTTRIKVLADRAAALDADPMTDRAADPASFAARDQVLARRPVVCP